MTLCNASVVQDGVRIKTCKNASAEQFDLRLNGRDLHDHSVQRMLYATASGKEAKEDLIRFFFDRGLSKEMINPKIVEFHQELVASLGVIEQRRKTRQEPAVMQEGIVSPPRVQPEKKPRGSLNIVFLAPQC